MARHVCGITAFALLALVAVGCKSGADTTPLRLDSLLSKQTTHGSQASAAVSTPSLPFSRSPRLSNSSPATGDYRVPQPFSTTQSRMAGVRGTFQQTATSIKDAITIQPKVIPAEDPTSLAHNPGPLQPDLYVTAAAVLEQQDRVTDAADKYQQALALDPNHRAALVGLARLQHRTGDSAGAIQTYQTALKAYPDDAMLLNDMGLCYARSGQADSALAALQRAVELKPNSTLYRNNMAAVLVEASRSAEAVPLLAQTYGTAVAYYNVGYLLHQRGEDHAAVEHFSAALRANPSLTPARSMLDRLVPQVGERPVRHQSPDRSRLPSAAATPMSPMSDTPVDRSANSPETSHAAYTILPNEANVSPDVIRTVATGVSTGQVSPASHVVTRQASDSTPEQSVSELPGADVPDALRSPIPGIKRRNPGRLVPPVPQPVTRAVQAGFLPTSDPPQPE